MFSIFTLLSNSFLVIRKSFSIHLFSNIFNILPSFSPGLIPNFIKSEPVTKNCGISNKDISFALDFIDAFSKELKINLNVTSSPILYAVCFHLLDKSFF